MSLISLGIMVGVGIIIISSNTPEARARRQAKIREQFKKAHEPLIKKGEKRQFINKFIDEIPELSYYEATQLKKKLGNIYLQWNDE
jgi:hypothetical protein